jgi:hypothetical protein
MKAKTNRANTLAHAAKEESKSTQYLEFESFFHRFMEELDEKYESGLVRILYVMESASVPGSMMRNVLQAHLDSLQKLLLGELNVAEASESDAYDDWWDFERTLHHVMQILVDEKENVLTLVRVLNAMRRAAPAPSAMLDVTDFYLNRIEEILVGELESTHPAKADSDFPGGAPSMPPTTLN